MSFSYGVGVHTLENKFPILIKGKRGHRHDEEILILGVTPGRVALYLGQTMKGVTAGSCLLTKDLLHRGWFISASIKIFNRNARTHNLVKEYNSSLYCSSKL